MSDDDVQVWMNASRLRLIASKTEVTWLDCRQQLKKIALHNVSILSATIATQTPYASLELMSSYPRGSKLGRHVLEP